MSLLNTVINKWVIIGKKLIGEHFRAGCKEGEMFNAEDTYTGSEKISRARPLSPIFKTCHKLVCVIIGLCITYKKRKY